MKKIIIAITVTTALLLCLVAGSALFAKSAMEDVARDALASLAGPGSETTAGSVVFSPITRELTVVNWSSIRRTPTGPGAMHADTMRGTVSFRGILACLPGICSLFMKDDTLVPLLSRLTLTGLRSENGGSRFEAARVSMKNIAMPCSLLRQYLAGNRPPFAQTAEGVYIESSSVDSLASSTVTAQGSSSVACRNIEIKGIGNCAIREYVVSGLNVTSGGQTVILGKTVLRGIRVSAALLSEIMAYPASGADKNPQALMRFARALQDNGPMFSTVSIENLSIPLPPAAPFTIRKTDMEWKSVKPMTAEAHIRGAGIPRELFEEVFGISLAGTRVVEGDVDLSSAGLEENRQQGLARFSGLFDLSWDFTYLPAAQGVRGATVTLRDYSLTAELARNITPDAHAAAMVLKISSRGLCSRDDEAGRNQCTRLESFIDAPGTITLSTHPGAVLTLPQLAGAFLMHQFGTFVNVSVTPGPRTLTQAVDALSARGAK